MFISFAIVNWNTRQMLRDCLTSIRRVAQAYRHEVLVADNGSHDGSPQMVESEFAEVVLVKNSRNLGFAAAHRQLYERAQGELHILVNSDVRLLEDALEAIVQRVESEPDIAVVGSQVLGPDGVVQPSCRRFPTLGRQFLQATGLPKLFPRSRRLNGYLMGDFDHKHARPVDQVMGSFFAMRRAHCREIGFLSDDYFMYYEEVDYCKRCQLAGYRVFFEAGARVSHEGGGSSRKVKVLTIRRTIRSMRHYFRTHVGAWTWVPLLWIVSLDMVTHTLFAVLTWREPLATLRAYGLGLWDLVCFKPANLAD